MTGANAGIVGMTKEHLGLSLALSVPVFVVVTKIDMCPPAILQDTLKLLVKILKSQGCRKVPVMVRNADEVVLSATNFVSERLCPIFQVSNVTGENLEFLKMFLNLLTTRVTGLDELPSEFQIDDTYSVPGGKRDFSSSLCSSSNFALQMIQSEQWSAEHACRESSSSTTSFYWDLMPWDTSRRYPSRAFIESE